MSPRNLAEKTAGNAVHLAERRKRSHECDDGLLCIFRWEPRENAHGELSCAFEFGLPRPEQRSRPSGRGSVLSCDPFDELAGRLGRERAPERPQPAAARGAVLPRSL